MFGLKDFSINFLSESILITSFLFALLILISIYIYRNTNPPLSKPIRVILSSLRIVAILALFMAIFEPVVSFTREYKKKPTMALLHDISASMDTMEKNESRQEKVDSLLGSASFKDFAGHFEIKSYNFADKLSTGDTPVNPEQTALGDVLLDMSRQETGYPSDFWLLLSDGISNSGITPADVLPQIHTPIYSLGVGEITTDRDVSIKSLDYNDVVFAGKPTEVSVRLEWTGMNNEEGKINIRSSGKLLQTKSIKLSPGNLQEEVKLKYNPEVTGRQTMEISVTGIADEITTKNNSRLFSVLVLKGKLNVLLVADKLDWEYAFLKRFLDESESIELTSVIFRENGGYLRGQFPSSQAELNRYDLVILYDLNERNIRSRSDILRSFLSDNGGGMFVLLGENYLKASFPRTIDQFIPFLSTGHNIELTYLNFNGRPDESYLFHPAVRIADSRRGIRDAWSSLPNFESLVQTDSTAPNSEIYVTAGLGDNDASFPILGCRRFGPGKVITSAAAPFWHWAFFGYGFGGNDAEYRQLLNGIINWLSLQEDSDPVRITPDKNVFTRGEKIGFNASVYDLGFRPIESATGYITIVGNNTSDSTVLQLLEVKDGSYRAELDLLPPGLYNYTGRVEKEGKLLKETTGQIAVETFSAEEFQIKPDFSTLAAISQNTGGAFYTLADIGKLYGAIDTGLIYKSEKSEIVLWNKFWLLVIFVLALGLEWLLRKKYQLI